MIDLMIEKRNYMLDKWRKPVPSLFTLAMDYVVDNLQIYSRNCDDLRLLPIKIKDQLLRKLTIGTFFWKEIDFKKTCSLIVHQGLRKIDLTSVVVDDELLQILEACIGLERVYLSTVGTHNFTQFGLMNFLACLPLLQFLQLRNCDAVENMVLAIISENCPKLSALDVGGCSKITDDGLKYLSQLNTLKCLTLSKSQITNNGLTNFVRGPNGANLKELKIDNCRNISESGLLAVTKYCPNLEILIFYNCAADKDETMSILEDCNMRNLRQLTFTVSW